MQNLPVLSHDALHALAMKYFYLPPEPSTNLLLAVINNDLRGVPREQLMPMLPQTVANAPIDHTMLFNLLSMDAESCLYMLDKNRQFVFDVVNTLTRGNLEKLCFFLQGRLQYHK